MPKPYSQDLRDRVIDAGEELTGLDDGRRWDLEAGGCERAPLRGLCRGAGCRQMGRTKYSRVTTCGSISARALPDISKYRLGESFWRRRQQPPLKIGGMRALGTQAG
jgi:hypothetical protein